MADAVPGNATFVDTLKGDVNAVFLSEPVKYTAHEWKDMTDIDRGGFNQIHLKRSAATIMTWLNDMQREKKDLTPWEIMAPMKEPAPAIAPSSRFARTKAMTRYGTAGLSAFGMIAGSQGFVKSYKEGDGFGMALNGANTATCTTDLCLNFAKAAGKADKVLGAVKFVNKANVVLNIADIAYETYKEPGNFVDRDADGDLKLGHKSERLIASTASAGAGMAGFAAGTALAGAIGGAVIFPAAVALADAYLVNKAANIIIDTRRTYEDVDKTFRPDMKRCGNMVGAMARVLGNAASNKSLIEAGVKPDPETGRVSMATLNAALADPEEGKYAMGRLKALIKNISDEDKKVKGPWTPRWIQFTDAQGEQRYKYESAKMEARAMDSALTEADTYVDALKKKRADASAAAQAELDGKMKTFNALSPEVQDDIVTKLHRDYGAYQRQAGVQAMDENSYVAFGKIAAANDAKLVATLTQREAELKPLVDALTGGQLADWKKQHPAATASETDAERKALSIDARREAIDNPKSFQQKLDQYPAQASPEPVQQARTAPKQAPSPAQG